MKKKVIFILSVIIFLSSIIVMYNKDKDEKLLSGEKTSGLSSKSLLSMMLETSYQSGEYKTATAKEFPKKGYIFNADLSKCENGGKVTWNDTTKTVVVTSNISDKCYFYFDKDILVEITDYKITPSESEITISLTATTDYGNIVKYYFSIDDGKTYKDSTTNSYTFSGLSAGVYNMRFYVEDSNGKRSDIVSESAIVLAKPTNPSMSFDNTYNVIISGSTSENGSVEYYYSFDNKTFTKGSSISVSSTTTIYAYAMDEKNQKSDVISKTVTIGTSQNGSVTSTYYCSRSGTYQSSSTCSFSYTASSRQTTTCTNGTLTGGKCIERIDDRSYDSNDQCKMWCEFFARRGTGEYSCVEDNYGQNPWSCKIVHAGTTTTEYVCYNGGTLDDKTCYGTESASRRYKCSINNVYYTSQASANSACTNYCGSGTYYNGKCYKIS